MSQHHKHTLHKPQKSYGTEVVAPEPRRQVTEPIAKLASKVDKKTSERHECNYLEGR